MLHRAQSGSSDTFLKVSGNCPICEQKVTFESSDDWLRDHFLCSGCGSIPRERALMYAIRHYYPGYRNLAIHESSSAGRGASARLARDCTDYLPSQYDPKLGFGQWAPGKRYRSEDLEQQSFADRSFDLVITQDVLEHVFHPERAFAEIARTLRPGGSHIFTTPLVNKFSPSEQWASMAEDGSVVHLHEPEYHGNPMDPNGSLVTYHWGYDIVDRIYRSSGLVTTVLVLDNLELGIRAEYIEVLISTKTV